MYGLTVRWSLTQAPADVLTTLRDYVAEESFPRFAAQPDLRFKSWRACAGQWFEGAYVFDSAEARADFQAKFEAAAAQSRVSQIVGTAPVLIEPCEIVAVVEGPAGFQAAARFEN